MPSWAAGWRGGMRRSWRPRPRTARPRWRSPPGATCPGTRSQPRTRPPAPGSAAAWQRWAWWRGSERTRGNNHLSSVNHNLPLLLPCCWARRSPRKALWGWGSHMVSRLGLCAGSRGWSWDPRCAISCLCPIIVRHKNLQTSSLKNKENQDLVDLLLDWISTHHRIIFICISCDSMPLCPSSGHVPRVYTLL